MSDPTSVVTPTGTPLIPSPVHRSDIPAGFNQTSGPGFTIAVPDGWKYTHAAASGSAPEMWVYQDAEGKKFTSAVAVALDATPSSGVLTQSYVLESTLQVRKPSVLNRTSVTWPGASTAVIIDWVIGDLHTQQLMTEREDGGPILGVLLKQKTSGPLDNTLLESLSTFTLTN